MIRLATRGLAVWAALAASGAPAMAETDAETTAAPGAHLTVELNAVDPVESACRMSFLIRNGYDSDITQAVFEAVLFDAEGRVERLTLFDFGDLPSARPRVRQFLVPDLDCAALGEVLINGAETCTGEGLDETACATGLELRSRTDVEVLG